MGHVFNKEIKACHLTEKLFCIFVHSQQTEIIILGSWFTFQYKMSKEPEHIVYWSALITCLKSKMSFGKIPVLDKYFSIVRVKRLRLYTYTVIRINNAQITSGPPIT